MKRMRINFTNSKLKQQLLLTINAIQVPLLNEAKYLGLRLDKRTKL